MVSLYPRLPRYDDIRNVNWRCQLVGAPRGVYDPHAVRSISGVTLSSEHVANRVKRVLVTL